MNALRLIRRFPVLQAALEDGRLNPTQLVILAPVLTPENVEALVLRATHLTKAKTKELAVSIQPREVPADGLRRLPASTASPAPVSVARPGPGPVAAPGPAADAPSVTHPDLIIDHISPRARQPS